MSRPRRLRRGIYLLPTLFTLTNLFCGYSAIVQTSTGNLELAAMLIILAAVLDGLDGRIARLSGSTSPFGVEFDSLADIVSFGIAPAMLAFHWGLASTKIGWSLAFMFLVCAAMRLARFNLQRATADKRFFAGMPSPMAGMMLASVVLAFPEPPISMVVNVAWGVVVFVVAILMISRLRYRSFKEFDLHNRRSYIYVLPLAAILVGVALHPEVVLLVLCAAYLLSGPVFYLAGLRRRGRVAFAPAVTDPPPAGATEVADEPALR